MTTSVLVVDDDPSIRFTVHEILSDAGVSTETADCGQDCIRRLQEGFHGLILMDVMMPEMNGWETITAMREQGLIEGNLICMLTAVQDPDPELDELKTHVLEYVRKPFTYEELTAVVGECLSYLD
jgi:CheY-like chemotaxis protein